MIDSIVQWGAQEGIGLLLVFCAAAIIFGSTFARVNAGNPSVWGWLRAVIEALAQAAAFVALLVLFRIGLGVGYDRFRSLDAAALQSKQMAAQQQWGGYYEQTELVVEHFVEVQTLEEVPRPNKSSLFRNVSIRQPVPQNSITKFEGRVEIQLSDSDLHHQKSPVYNNYYLTARYDYTIRNNADVTTEAVFHFPLLGPSAAYDNFAVFLDDRNLTSEIVFEPNGVMWKRSMQPGEIVGVRIAYGLKGIEGYAYYVPAQRELDDFTFRLEVNDKDFYVISEPDARLLPAKYENADNRHDAVLTWSLNDLIISPKLGIFMFRPEDPYAPHNKAIQFLGYGPAALFFAGGALALTRLIRRGTVQLSTTAFWLAAYCIPFLLVAGATMFAVNLWVTIGIGAGLSLVLTVALFWTERPRGLGLLSACIAVAMGLAYPIGHFIVNEGQQGAYDGIVKVLLLIYLFFLALYSKLKSQPALQKPQAISG